MKTGIAIVATMIVLSGCSPYVYRTEIGGFAAGVGHLAAAYDAGLKALGTERAEHDRWTLTMSGAALVLTPDCQIGGPAADPAKSPCAVHDRNKPAPAQTLEQRAAFAKPLATALKKYADALAAVANAEDEQALIAAQADFKNAVLSLPQVSKEAQASFGAVSELVFAIGRAALNQRRYRALRVGVSAAHEPVATLGGALAEALDTVRTLRANELRESVQLITTGMGSKITGDEYMRRVTVVQERVAAIESLRVANPAAAARDMVDAHAKLVAALNDPSRQIDAVVSAVSDFVSKAKAAREALGGQ